jgi:hypothetical protein
MKAKHKEVRVAHTHRMPKAMKLALMKLADESGQTFVGYANAVLAAHIRMVSTGPTK